MPTIFCDNICYDTSSFYGESFNITGVKESRKLDEYTFSWDKIGLETKYIDNKSIYSIDNIYDARVNNNKNSMEEVVSKITSSTKNSRVIDLNQIKDYHDNLSRLREIGLLENNWNDNGAKKFSNDFINKMEVFINEVCLQPQVFPTARESIQLEYEKETGEYLEFEIFQSEDNKVFVFQIDSEDNETDMIVSDISEMNRIIKEFNER